MKKTISILLLFVFLFSSSGFSINTHFCNGKLKSVKIVVSDNCKQCCGKKKCTKGCCKNKTEIVKIKDNYIPAQIIIPPSILTTFALAFIQSFNLSITENNLVVSNLNYLYPPDKPISLSILYRSILIWFIFFARGTQITKADLCASCFLFIRVNPSLFFFIYNQNLR